MLPGQLPLLLFFFFRKIILMRVGATAGKCLAQSLTLPPPHTLAQTPLYLLTGTGAPDPSWCSVLCSLCQSNLTFEMKPTPYACLRLWLWILYHDLSSRHPIILLWLPQHLEIQRTIWCWFTEYPLDQWCLVYAKLDWLIGICLSPPPTKLVL